jgi:DNA repair protein RAD5
MEWWVIFVDECADITNMDATVTKAVSALKGKRRVGSTGTPVQNDYHNLHALAVFLGLEPWNDWKYFKQVATAFTSLCSYNC